MAGTSFRTNSTLSKKANRLFGQKDSHSNTGFTIVELLIVIVVIAILAAITIVAYNGIQNSAKASSVQATVKQAATKIKTHAIRNGDTLPSSLAIAGVPNADGTTYQYQINNVVNPGKFCISARKDAIAFFVTSTQSSPQQGTCYEQSLVSADINDWEPGDYSQATGNPTSSTSRMRHLGLISVDPGATYLIDTGNSSYSLVVRAFKEDLSFATSIGAVAPGSTLVIPANVQYLGVSIYNPSGGSITYDTYVQAFANSSIVPSVTRVE